MHFFILVIVISGWLLDHHCRKGSHIFLCNMAIFSRPPANFFRKIKQKFTYEKTEGNFFLKKTITVQRIPVNGIGKHRKAGVKSVAFYFEGFRYSLRILCTMVLAFLFLYKVCMSYRTILFTEFM